MPRLLREAELDLVAAEGALYADIGTSRFWLGAAESYGALLSRSGLLPPTVVDDGGRSRPDRQSDGTFFGASNYFTYLTRRPG